MTESTRDPVTVPIPPLSAYANASFDELVPVLDQIAAGASDRARVDAAGGLVLHRALRLLRVESRETLLKEGMALDGFLYSAAGSAIKTAQPDVYWGWIGISGLLGEAARRSDRAAVDSILASHAGRGRDMLELLAEHGAPVPRSEIRDRLKLSESHLSHLLRDLAEADLIERAKAGREVAVALGPVGREVVKRSVLPEWVRYLCDQLQRVRTGTAAAPAAEFLATALSQRGAPSRLVAQQLAEAVAGGGASDWTHTARENARRRLMENADPQLSDLRVPKKSLFSGTAHLHELAAAQGAALLRPPEAP